MECEGAHSVRGQLHCVQQSDLNEAVGFSATDWPVLVALHLQGNKQGRVQGCLEVPKGSEGQGSRGRGREGGLAHQDTRHPSASAPLCHSVNHIRSSHYIATPALAGGLRAVIEIYLFMIRSHQAHFLPNLPITFMCHFQAL